ncbi:MAG: histidinol phosphate phosphatase domain-containing protein [Actinobacteria bacterium]|nr:histidinol phosphate phosphatase domain-containing protein [Actinomycetota bacterium]
MTYDFHTHTFLSDGSSSPIELIRFAYAYGYKCIGITDHGSYSNLERVIGSVKKDCELAEKYWDIIAIPGIELTNIPAVSVDEMARSAKELGVRMVAVHGESIAEEVEEGTNLAAVKSEYVDMLAHPGLITSEEAMLAAKNDIYIEITKRVGHSLTNGRVVEVGRKAGVKFLLNSDSHNYPDLYRGDFQKEVALGSGLSIEEYNRIIDYNQKEFLKKIGYK